MINHIKIRNFGPIRDEVELNFESALPKDDTDEAYVTVMPDDRRLLKLLYIYGANASGKTTVLQVFEFIRLLWLEPFFNKSEELDFEPFLFCEAPLEQTSSLELAFYANNIRHIYTLEFTKTMIRSERLVFFHSAKPTLLFSRETDAEKQVVKLQFGSQIGVPARERDRLESNTLYNNSVMGAFTKTNVDIPELNTLQTWMKRFFLGMITSDTDLAETTADMIVDNPAAAEWIAAFMRKADRQISKVAADPEKSYQPRLRPNFVYEHLYPAHVNTPFSTKKRDGILSGLDLSDFKRKVAFTHETGTGNFELPLSAESRGTQRYFALGGPMYRLIHDEALLLIDELESSLHPDLMKHFLQTFLANATFSQLLITTHNIALLEEEDFIRRDALWFIEKKDDGSADLYSAADFDSATLRKGASLINAYRAGRLGAKPNLGSPLMNK
ncbi:ATP/GTP-binding protein [Mucilaginibacter sp.]|jgi:AAA15 family ATPase/GTPase|uniref:AAA family ATPase n=1 Tax=Mucilaginibacter sp. TaxID=1882438 RepID=UPI00356AE71D